MNSSATTMVSFVSPDRELGLRLLPVARQIFSETFAHLYDKDAFDAFCEQTYALDGPMAKDLADPAIRWRVATYDDEPIGYAKLTPLRAPFPDAHVKSLELQQIYVLARWHGKGIAEELMHWAVDLARRAGAMELYLTVFDHNERAKRFYVRHGFAEVGRCTFTLGNRVEEDRVWRKNLSVHSAAQGAPAIT